MNGYSLTGAHSACQAKRMEALHWASLRLSVMISQICRLQGKLASIITHKSIKKNNIPQYRHSLVLKGQKVCPCTHLAGIAARPAATCLAVGKCIPAWPSLRKCFFSFSTRCNVLSCAHCWTEFSVFVWHRIVVHRLSDAETSPQPYYPRR